MCFRLLTDMSAVSFFFVVFSQYRETVYSYLINRKIKDKKPRV